MAFIVLVLLEEKKSEQKLNKIYCLFMTDMGTRRSSSSYTQTDIIYSVEILPILHSHSTTLVTEIC